ncbi:MAG: archaeosortase/exosortase family protein, partial [Myxococcota bacterium]
MSDSQGPATSATPRTPAPTPRWLVWLGVAAGLFAYRPLLTLSSTEDLSQQAEDWLFMPSDTAPLVVLVLCAWLIYRRRDRWRALPPASSHPVAVASLLAAGTLVLAWATLTSATNLLPVSLALMLLGTAALLRGQPGLRVVGLPAAFLLF